MHTNAALAIASKSDGASCYSVANAHAVLASSCALNSPMRAVPAIASKSKGAGWFKVANPHATFANPCGANLSMQTTALLAMVSNNRPSTAIPSALPNAHIRLDISCALKLFDCLSSSLVLICLDLCSKALRVGEMQYLYQAMYNCGRRSSF